MSDGALVPPREKLADGDTRVKRHDRVVRLHLDLRVDKQNFTNCCPNVDLPTNVMPKI